LALAAVLIGCGGGDQLDVYPVHGRVTFEGKPLAGGGSIAFVPTTNQVGKTAGGTIREDGTYELSTYGEGDGSIPGEFRVVVTQFVVKEPEASPDGSAPLSGPIPTVAEADRIPAVYADHQNSPLTATVEAKDSNEIDFDLKRRRGN
jgi:hypothetical protein